MQTKFLLSNKFHYPYPTALSRIRRCKLNGDGIYCPLYRAEHKFVKLILVMSKMKRSLNVSDGLNLINDIIAGTELQKQLIEWKKLHHCYYQSEIDLGKVGLKYWRGFMSRNGNKLKSKNGRKYAVDRSNFTSYLNFKDMYDQIEEVLVESNLAKYFPEPVYMNQNGDIVNNECESYGCKVKIDLMYRDLCITMDEVGCNLTQERDGAKGGRSFYVEMKRHHTNAHPPRIVTSHVWDCQH